MQLNRFHFYKSPQLLERRLSLSRDDQVNEIAGIQRTELFGDGVLVHVR